MEKRTPHYPLAEVKRLMGQPASRRITRSALDGALNLGAGQAEIVATVLGLSPRQFFKSMTSHADHTVWQDVYHARLDGVALYVKVQIVEYIGVVISFKER